MSEQVCRLCNHPVEFAFTEKVLNKYGVSYFSCPNCQYFQTEKPYWLEEAYTNVINDEDLGILRRNLFLSNFIMLWHMFRRSQGLKYLDFSGGYGILVRLMRDAGFNFKWTDKYCENIFAKDAVAEQGERFNFVTSFEVIEHVERPLDFIKELGSFGNTDILFSTMTFTNERPDKNWFYLGFNHGQHIGFFNAKSLQELARLSGYQLTSFRNLHLLSRKKHSRTLFFLTYMISYIGLPKVFYSVTRVKPLD